MAPHGGIFVFLTVGNHARPAGMFVKEASVFPCNVTIAKGDKEVDAKRIFGVMSLGAKMGEENVIRADGDKEEAIEMLGKFLEERTWYSKGKAFLAESQLADCPSTRKKITW